MYWNSLSDEDRENLQVSFWMGDPEVRHYINEQVSGCPDTWTVEWFQNEYRSYLPFQQAVVIGCGTGELERDLVARAVCERALAMDIAPNSVDKAKQLAAESGLLTRIDYQVGDGRQWLRQQPNHSLSAVFFHAALHHFDRISEVLELVRTKLRPDGILFVDEYVGPSMSQWNALLLLPANLAYYLLPASSRRVRLIRAPLNPQDPTECICSADILPALYNSFEVLERRDYDGNLLFLIYANLRREAGSNRPARKTVRRLIRLERLFRAATRRLRPPFHTVIVAKPKAT